MTTHLVIRADGSRTRGLGHLLRGVALAEAARVHGLTTSFVVTEDPVAEATLDARAEVHLAVQATDRSWLDDLGPDVALVVDGEHLHDLVALAHERGARVAVVDDAGGEHPAADVVVCADQAGPSGPAPPRPVRLFGPDHALVRAEFRAHRGDCAPAPAEVLAIVGGTDPGDHLGRVTAAAAARLPTTPVRPLREAVAEHGGEVAAALAAAGAAVSAAGTSAWELLCLGVPAALVVVADDQRLPAALIDAARAAVVLGPVEEALAGGLAGLEALLDPVERDRLSAAGRALVDGRGPERVVEVLCS